MIQSATHHSMDLWGPRRTTSLKEARNRTGIVHIVRLLFTCAAVLAAGFLIGPVVQHAFLPQAATLNSPSLNVTMLNPRFDGIDSAGKPYVLTADTARRRRDDPSLVDLVNPKLDDMLGNTARARQGVYDKEHGLLDLVDNVVMTDPSGYTFTSHSSRVFINDDRVEGQEPVHGIGPQGEMTADTYQVLEDGKHVVLRGHVWTRIVPTDEPAKTPGAPAKAAVNSGPGPTEAELAKKTDE